MGKLHKIRRRFWALPPKEHEQTEAARAVRVPGTDKVTVYFRGWSYYKGAPHEMFIKKVKRDGLR